MSPDELGEGVGASVMNSMCTSDSEERVTNISGAGVGAPVSFCDPKSMKVENPEAAVVGGSVTTLPVGASVDRSCVDSSCVVGSSLVAGSVPPPDPLPPPLGFLTEDSSLAKATGNSVEVAAAATDGLGVSTDLPQSMVQIENSLQKFLLGPQNPCSDLQ